MGLGAAQPLDGAAVEGMLIDVDRLGAIGRGEGGDVLGGGVAGVQRHDVGAGNAVGHVVDDLAAGGHTGHQEQQGTEDVLHLYLLRDSLRVCRPLRSGTTGRLERPYASPGAYGAVNS